MTKVRNKHIISADEAKLKALQEEYQEYGDFDTRLEYDSKLRAFVLTIFALKRRKPKKDKEKNQRNKRSEKFERK